MEGCHRHVGWCVRWRTSRDLLGPHLASPNCVLGIGPCKALSRRPYGLSCAVIWHCDLSPLAARSARFPPGLRLDWAGPAHVDSQNQSLN
ncbi:MAG: hypothetical protein JSR39_00570 [Verrucomicrobia bacterium]|nr:hypothetical protein [Verrucomicrobiota bacterium]